VRRAFELSLDRDAINQVVYAGLYAPDAQAVPDSSPFHFAYKPPARDVAKAKALLKEAGVTTPFVINLMTGPTPDARQVAEVIQSMAAEAGFDVKITVVEFASSLQASSRGDFEAYYINWSGRVDADGNLYSFLRSDGALNDGKYANPKVDAALDEARTVTDVAQRRDIYARMWQQVSADVPLIYLWHAQNLVGLSAAVQGFRPISDGMIRLQGLSLAK
jgi:peptide/nickel transport system substrate-binding protein